MQEALKERIKAWLKTSNRSRAWLATETAVKKRTVDNWLSSPQEIPLDKQGLIEKLIEADEAAEAQRRIQLLPQAQIFSLEVDLPTFRAFSAAALAAGKTIEQWSIDSLNELAAEYQRTGLMPDIRETKSTVAGIPVRILESAAPSLPRSGTFLPLVGGGASMPTGAVASLAASIAKAAAELHPESPSTHRDISAEKLGLNEQPAKFTDFGSGSHGDHDPVTHDRRPMSKAADQHQDV